MALEPLSPNDPRVEHHFLDVGEGVTYHYLLAKPKQDPVATCILFHGWPDHSMGWRFQVPLLQSLGLRVIVPDQLGYGQTSAPESLALYGFKKLSSDMAQLVRAVTGTDDEPVIVGGHDWGAYLAWRFALHHPSLVRAVFSFCVPFFPPDPSPPSLEEFVARSPQFGYQIQNASGEAEAFCGQSERHLRGFLNTMYGGATPEGLHGFDPTVGVVKDRLLDVGPSPLVPKEMMDFYVSEYSRHGLNGPMNWYKTRSINAEDEKPLVSDNCKISIPAMLVMAGQDIVLLPELATGQERFFGPPGLKQHLIEEASHWVLVQCPEESNRYIEEFVKMVLKI